MKDFLEFAKESYGISDKVSDLYIKAMKNTTDVFERIDNIAEYNTLKVLKAFKDNKISTIHFAATYGYGYDDIGREALDKTFSQIFDAEDAMVRHNIISGTHAIALCLFAVLRPGDTLVAVTGKPYDTLEETIGLRGEEGVGSLKDFGVKYEQVDLIDGDVNYEGILSTVTPKTKAVIIQKSKGYDWRKTLSCEELGKLIKTVKSINKDIVCIVDNCYGEFTEKFEPTHYGADLVAGSLIKNPGGGIAVTGGYVAGKRKYVEMAAYKLNSVGIGKESGATLGLNRSMIMGIFMAPHTVSEAIKAAALCAEMLSLAGFEVNPRSDEPRYDIIQSVKLASRENVIGFCQGIQAGSPVDAYITPVPCELSGYADGIIMAAGGFTQGASIEISADAPIKAPYIAYMQGGLTFDSAKVAILTAVNNILGGKEK